MIWFPVSSLPSSLAPPPLAHFSPTTQDMLLFLKPPRPHLSTIAPIIPSALTTLLWDTFMAHFLISFRSLLKCYLLSEAFPDHLIQDATTSPHPTISYFGLSHTTVWLTICFTYLSCFSYLSCFLTFSVSSFHNISYLRHQGRGFCLFLHCSILNIGRIVDT